MTQPSEIPIHSQVVKYTQINGKDVKGSQCITDETGRLNLSAMDRKATLKERREEIINEEND